VIVAHLERLASELFCDLAARGGAAAALHVEMQLDCATSQRLTLAVNRPVCSASPFLTQLNERLRKMRFSSAVTGLSIALGGITQAAAPQLELRRLERRSSPSEGGRSGPMPPTVESVSIPRLVASHLPEASFTLVATPAKPARHPAAPDAYRPAYASGPLAGLRLISPPERATITAQHGRPKTLHLESRARNVRTRLGPWELSGRWWGVEFDRRYFEIETDRAERCLVFYDCNSTQWYLQGIFD